MTNARERRFRMLKSSGLCFCAEQQLIELMGERKKKRKGTTVEVRWIGVRGALNRAGLHAYVNHNDESVRTEKRTGTTVR